MSQHAPSQKWQRDVLGEEDSPNGGVNICKGVADAAHDNIFKGRRVSHENRLGRGTFPIPLDEELIRQFEHYSGRQLCHPVASMVRR